MNHNTTEWVDNLICLILSGRLRKGGWTQSSYATFITDALHLPRACVSMISNSCLASTDT